jgi:hypothetical protein
MGGDCLIHIREAQTSVTPFDTGWSIMDLTRSSVLSSRFFFL